MQRLRRRLPLVAFILLVVLCLLVVGFACACFSDQPMQAVDRALSTGPALPPLIEVWSFVAAAAAIFLFVLYRPVAAGERASPAVLQRFLF
jgi:hypothetical protein